MPAWKGIIGQGFTIEQFDTYAHSVTFPGWKPQFVVLHNTGAPRLSQWHSVPGAQRMANLQAYYRDQQHWSAGPHLFVADDLIWVFTPLNTSGVHSPSWNGISWGVEMVGDYETEPFSPAVKNNAAYALAILHSIGGLDPHTLRLHKEDPKTTHLCPGKNVGKQEMIDATLQAMAAHFAGEHVPGHMG
ncbi:peptidoglycan recognition protein family protein [Terriglobus tenax]|uniref:peptidoglycan recognition protein family protein n=1 Tax=Terriglobus tenax TaxID=1111115 RepID=UPI0021DF7688|nr:peptidoglycan recognition family protein [Terriglobus tenax]